MNTKGQDIINLIISLGSLISMFMGVLSTFCAIAVCILSISFFIYHKIPWAHKNWKKETISDSVATFYNFSKVFHTIVVFTLTLMIFASILVGFAIKSGPNIISTQAANEVWNSNNWNTSLINSSTIPKELQKAKKDDQPYAVMMDDIELKAAPLRTTLSVLADKLTYVFLQILGGIFFVTSVIVFVLYPTEQLAEARTKREGC
ncbi:hypothetical protein [Pseudoalteromonas rubra]|uniref:Uncharacterized protein n=1 Tax=Pseudoalteromonas rubra TaxID=43658 RepID=A0A0F4QHI4_9GAMM|nr:hypothetical protein [Pseudoalteromonas rubra]KJZ06745.1 hypothetical protein TW77_18245 [Pseudoalteromonas rubra]